jgi:predicted N-acyltransferase
MVRRVPAALRLLDRVSAVEPAAWDALTAGDEAGASPFVRHAWLDALERSGCATARKGWAARHLALFRGGELVAAAPAWVRHGSDGDFSRDWQWAAAALRAGLPFHPKLVLGVPFTPATGRRLLVRPGEDRAAAVRALAEGALALARDEGLGTVQVLFPLEEEARELEPLGFARRLDFQYHWRNAGYATPEEFLARFPSKRRNALRRERAAPAAQGIAIRTVRGDELARDPAGWARAVFELHRTTVDRMDWGMRFVNRAFYEAAFGSMPDALEVVEARRDGRLVAMAFNAASAERLYGRYWGAAEDHPFLHFNVCLYHSIDECIRRGVKVFEGGAGGEHKLPRGFEPAEVWSAHAFTDARLGAAMRRLVAAEAAAREEALARFREASPIFKKVG